MTGPSPPPDPGPKNQSTSPTNQFSPPPTSGPPPQVPLTHALPAPPAPGVSYSAKLKVNVNRNERLKRNVLEINLDIDQGSSPNIENEIVARLLGRLGIDLTTQVEGIQIRPGNSRKIFVWMKDSIDLTKYCKEESFRVTEGVKTSLIKPMDKLEVSVLVKGLNFNTPDTLVLEYLGKHGKIVNAKVIYVTDKEGPTKGIKNGDRRYCLDFSDGLNLGSYHIIDGAKVLISYPGQLRTCGRCHQNSKQCPGGGVAKQCDLKNGIRVRLEEHMRSHWDLIGFVPSNFKLDIDDSENLSKTADVEIKTNNNFTPPSKKLHDQGVIVNNLNFKGIAIKNLPEKIPDDEIEAFLRSKGLESDSASVVVKRNKKNTAVDVEKIEPEESKLLIENLHEKVFFNQKIYCRGIRNLESPIKDSQAVNDSSEKSVPQIDDKEPDSSRTIPGLPEEEIKKAQNKAEKKRKEKEKKELNEMKGVKINKLKRGDFLKESVKEFAFENAEEEGTGSGSDNESSDGYETPTNDGFFTFSPVKADENVNPLLSPSSYRSRAAKQIRKDELWKSIVTPAGMKRGPSPTNSTDRRIRAKSISLIPLSKSSQLCNKEFEADQSSIIN